jgi:K+-transporting ATPase c subunit
MSTAELQVLIDAATDHAVLGYIGQDGVNVTRLNAALANR